MRGYNLFMLSECRMAQFHTILGSTDCIASTRGNRWISFRSNTLNVFDVFFFLGCALVAAHRIAWYGSGASLGSSALEQAIDDVVSRLKAANSECGCAIARCVVG